MSTSKSLELVNVTLLGKRVFADVIKDPEMRSCWITQMGPKFNDECYQRQKRRQRREKPQEDRGRDWSSPEAYQPPLEVGKEQIVPQSLWREHRPANTLISDF